MRSDAKDPRQPSPWEYLIAALVMSALVLWGLLSATSCSTIKYVDRWNTEYRDTTIYEREVKDSLIYVPIPLESNQVIVHLGDTSKLETSVARSEAFVGGDGLLHHSLRNKREKLPALVPVTSTTIHTGVTSNEVQTITRIEWRDKPLTAWQSFRLRAFGWLLVAVVLLLLWTFRKPLLKLICL